MWKYGEIWGNTGSMMVMRLEEYPRDEILVEDGVFFSLLAKAFLGLSWSKFPWTRLDRLVHGSWLSINLFASRKLGFFFRLFA